MNETNVFASRPSFPQKHFWHKKCVKRKSQGFNESHVLAGPVQGLFVCRIALFYGGRRNTPKAVKYTEKILHRSLYTGRPLHRAAFTRTLLHTNASTYRSFYTEKPFLKKPYHAKPLHRAALHETLFHIFLHTGTLNTQMPMLSHTGAFAHTGPYTKKL